MQGTVVVELPVIDASSMAVVQTAVQVPIEGARVVHGELAVESGFGDE